LKLEALNTYYFNNSLRLRCCWYNYKKIITAYFPNDSSSHPRIFYLVLLPTPLKIIPPTTPAAMATPLRIATPIKPSLATLSSIKPLRLAACKFAGSFSNNKSLYRRASA
jgi:hypothetical protein